MPISIDFAEGKLKSYVEQIDTREKEVKQLEKKIESQREILKEINEIIRDYF